MGRIKFASYNIDVEELTVKELKDYIRNGVDFINDYLDEVEELRKPQKNFLKEIDCKCLYAGSHCAHNFIIDKKIKFSHFSLQY